jgi:membrane associated rhomboid family serine protease
MAEVELNVVCKHCGAEVSPYITECPYCGNRLRKRAPKLEARGSELAPKEKRGLFARRKPKPRRERGKPSLEWLSANRPYATIALVLAGAAVYLVDRTGSLGYRDLGAVVGPIDGEWWRLIAAQFNYTNVGYLFGVGVATAIFGTSLERRYGAPVTVALFLGCGAVGMYLATVIETFPIALGGSGAALGLAFAWFVRDLRDRRSGYDTESDLLGFAAIAIVLMLMPVLDDTANWWAGLGGAAAGALAGLALPARRAG